MRTSSIAVAMLAASATFMIVHPASAQTAGPALDDATIVAIFDAANTVDIETGRLAAERGSTKAVREYGEMLVRDHSAVRQQGRDLAGKLHVTPTPPAGDAAAKAHARTMTSLRALEGDAFDRAFLQHEIAFHKGVIDAIEGRLLPAIRNDELRALVVRVAPAFQAHMVSAEHLLGKTTQASR